MVVTLKLQYGDDIRKVSFDALSLPILFDKIRSLFDDLAFSEPDNLYLYYIDDEGDRIRVKFEVELSEAARQASSDRVLKMFIINLSSPVTSLNASTITPIIQMLSSASNNTLPYKPLEPEPVNNFPVFDLTSSPVVHSTFSNSPIITSHLSSSHYYPSSSSSPFSSPSPYVVQEEERTTCESGVSASPEFSSVSTSTLIDAKDAATDTPLVAVTQTTQTLEQSNAHQTTQTQANATSSTQTMEGASATQTTQTHQNASCSTQTAQDSQTHRAQACETQTPYEPPALSFYDSLIGTQFGDMLEKLQELGFTDKEKCVKTLVKYSGRLPEAIDELLLSA